MACVSQKAALFSKSCGWKRQLKDPLGWIAARFAGKPAPCNCVRLTWHVDRAATERRITKSTARNLQDAANAPAYLESA